jgi:hypothetical protein
VASATTSSPSQEDVERTGSGNVDAEAGGGGGDGGGANGRDSSYQRYDIQHAARWIEQVLPFSLLLLVVFIRQHLQGSFLIPNFHLLIITINENQTMQFVFFIVLKAWIFTLFDLL